MEQSINEQLLSSIHHIPVAMLLLDNKGDCRYANRLFEQLVGVEEGYALGKGWLRHHAEQERTDIHDTLRTGTTLESCFLISGEEIWVRLMPVVNADGSCCCVCEKCGHDLHSVSKKSDHIGQAEQKTVMQEILDNTDAILYSVDQLGKITHFNKSASHAMAARRGTAVRIGDYWPDIVSGDSGLDRERMILLMDYVLCGKSYKIIEDVQVENGEKITYSVQASPIFDTAQSVIGAVLCAHDITKLTKLQREAEEKAQRRTVELERWNKFYDMLLAVLAHDLRQPLSVVVMTADMFSRSSKDFSAQEIRKIMGNLRNTSSKSIELLQGLLYWVKSKKENFSYLPEPLNLFDLVAEANALFIQDQANKNVCFCNDVPRDQALHAHQQMMLFVLRNLISNATKYAHNHSTIYVRSTVSNDEITIAIEDSGKGMSQDQLSSLFDIKEHEMETAGFRGAGMALTIVHDMVGQMRGTIHAESTIGQGTTFYLSFPLSA